VAAFKSDHRQRKYGCIKGCNFFCTVNPFY
jgi:hypothetical protein